jgi:hypothetical protein
MPITKRVETKTEVPEVAFDDAEDLERDAALERAFLQHDTLEFRGEPLNPMSAETWALMQQAGLTYLFTPYEEGVERPMPPLWEIAASILIHMKDNRRVRYAIYTGDKVAFMDMVYDFLSEVKSIEEVTEVSDAMSKIMTGDFFKTRTTTVGGGAGQAKKKSGNRTG